ncbi:MAG: GNAT family N-acetyltransferase [Anaerolineales bacterium]|nr:GNAT family N-acetyltransferase [Anaerolineales bacterium]
MSQVEIRSAVANDLNVLMQIDHACQTDYVWQMDIQSGNGQAGAVFREIRLPRSVSVAYPRSVSSLADDWSRRSGILVAVVEENIAGYLRLTDRVIPQTGWITDLAVAVRYRRQGIASALVLAAQSWAAGRKNRHIIIEMSSKNNPAIQLAQKLGYEFCGYNDRYYESRDIAVFFGRPL